MHNNSLCLSAPTFTTTVFALVRKLFCLSPGLSEAILRAVMSGLWRKATRFFLSVLLHVQSRENSSPHVESVHDLYVFWVSPPSLVLRFTSVSEQGCYLRHFFSQRLFPECGDEKQRDVSHEPSAWQAARCARDVMSHGTQHLFPLGPIIATPRLRIHQPSSDVIGVACWWLHFPSATVWVMAKENVQFIGEWNAIT